MKIQICILKMTISWFSAWLSVCYTFRFPFFLHFEWNKKSLDDTHFSTFNYASICIAYTHCANCEMFASSITCITFHIWNSQKKHLGRRKLYFHIKRFLKFGSKNSNILQISSALKFEFSRQKIYTIYTVSHFFSGNKRFV